MLTPTLLAMLIYPLLRYLSPSSDGGVPQPARSYNMHFVPLTDLKEKTTYYYRVAAYAVPPSPPPGPPVPDAKECHGWTCTVEGQVSHLTTPLLLVEALMSEMGGLWSPFLCCSSMRYTEDGRMWQLRHCHGDTPSLTLH
jgi:hypothetical protein